MPVVLVGFESQSLSLHFYPLLTPAFYHHSPDPLAHSCAGKYVVEPRDALEARRYEWCFIYVRQGVQCRVAFRSANSSVPGIGTRWRHEVDYGTGVAPIFGPEVVRRDLIFLNEVWV